jgi:integrase
VGQMLKSCAIDTPAKRARLVARKNPYWQGVSGGRGGLSLGYRTALKGPGSWVAKVVIDGRRIEERFATANDTDMDGTLSYPAAVAAVLDWGKQQAAVVEAIRATEAAAKVPTVRLAIEAYATARKARAGRAGSEGSLKLHVLSDSEFSKLRLAKLGAQDIEDWRARLPISLLPSTKNRLLNDLRAALYSAAVRYRRLIPAHIPAEIKVGTKAESLEATPRRQLLSDTQIRNVVEAAFDIDMDFGWLVLLHAATGARFSQLAAVTVLDLQVNNARVMVPSSRKGKNRQPGKRVAVPLTSDVVQRFKRAVAGRSANERLLMRWGYKRIGGPGKWARDKRQAWAHAYEVEKHWAATVERSGIPADTVMYALRHSSIVRGLRSGLPVRLVAALHDTSVEMIEKHYAAFIIDMTEDLARKVLMSFNEPAALLQAAE